MAEQFTNEEMIAALNAAGWKAKTPTLWQAPWGTLFLGPAQAFKVMQHWPRRNIGSAT